MKYLKFLVVGILFGVLMTKAEVVSWYRIYEMFKFQSFHMYGIIGSAVVLGIILIQIMKRTKMKSIEGTDINYCPKAPSIPRYLIGGIIFGLGWALTGACPGPMMVVIGNGYPIFIVMIISASLGTFVYGLVRHKLPH